MYENPPSYTWTSQICTGQQAVASKRKQGKPGALDLAHGLGRGYQTTCNNFFTSFKVAMDLVKHQKTKKKVPRIMLSSKSKHIYSSMFLSIDNFMVLSMFHAKIK